MASHRPLQGLIFDLDGVLTDTVPYHYRAWKRLAEDENFTFTHEDNERIRGLSRRDGLLAVLGDAAPDEKTLQAWLKRKNRYYKQLIAQMSVDHILPGVPRLLMEARAAGLQLAVGSSSKNARLILDRLGLSAYFDVIGDGHTVKNTKPAPDIFLWCADKLGLPPAHIIVFEDSAAGVQAALSGGFLVVGLGNPANVARAPLILPDLGDITLPDLLRRLRELESAA